VQIYRVFDLEDRDGDVVFSYQASIVIVRWSSAAKIKLAAKRPSFESAVFLRASHPGMYLAASGGWAACMLHSQLCRRTAEQPTKTCWRHPSTWLLRSSMVSW
jgi:hypothetical protein